MEPISVNSGNKRPYSTVPKLNLEKEDLSKKPFRTYPKSTPSPRKLTKYKWTARSHTSPSTPTSSPRDNLESREMNHSAKQKKISKFSLKSTFSQDWQSEQTPPAEKNAEPPTHIPSLRDFSLSRSSPRSATENQSCKIERSPKMRGLENLKSSDEIRLSKSKRKSNDHQIVTLLNSAWKKKMALPLLDVEKIKLKIYLQCRGRIENWCTTKRADTFTELYIKATKNNPKLIKEIQSSDLLISEAIASLKILKSEHDTLCKDFITTQWSSGFSNKLGEMIEIGEIKTTKEDSVFINRTLIFMKLLDDFYQLKDNEHGYALIEHVLGGDKRDIDKVITLWRNWSSNNEKMLSQLDKYNIRACGDVILDRELRFQQGVYPLPIELVNVLKNITSYEVFRCIKPSHSVLFDSIVINGHNFHQSGEFSESTESYSSDRIKTFDFWLALLTEIYTHCGIELSNFQLTSQVSEFFIEKNRIQSMSKSGEIPCIKVLQLMCQSCWGIFNQLLSTLCPLLSSPFKLRALQGTDCLLKLTSLDYFEVHQKKKFTLYRLLNADEPLSHYDEKRPLAQLTISWGIEVKGGKYLGKLEIPRDEFKIYPETTKEERALILQELCRI